MWQPSSLLFCVSWASGENISIYVTMGEWAPTLQNHVALSNCLIAFFLPFIISGQKKIAPRTKTKQCWIRAGNLEFHVEMWARTKDTTKGWPIVKVKRDWQWGRCRCSLKLKKICILAECHRKALRQSQGVRMFIFTPRFFILERRVTAQKHQLYHKLSLKYCTGQRKREQIELSLFFVLK